MFRPRFLARWWPARSRPSDPGPETPLGDPSGESGHLSEEEAWADYVEWSGLDEDRLKEIMRPDDPE